MGAIGALTAVVNVDPLATASACAIAPMPISIPLAAAPATAATPRQVLQLSIHQRLGQVWEWAVIVGFRQRGRRGGPRSTQHGEGDGSEREKGRGVSEEQRREGENLGVWEEAVCREHTRRRWRPTRHTQRVCVPLGVRARTTGLGAWVGGGSPCAPPVPNEVSFRRIVASARTQGGPELPSRARRTLAVSALGWGSRRRPGGAGRTGTCKFKLGAGDF